MDGPPKVTLVYFIGGCTHAEISALRFLAQQENSEYLNHGFFVCISILRFFDSKLLLDNFLIWEARWPNGKRAGLRIERSGFGPWPGLLCCVLGKDTLLS